MLSLSSTRNFFMLAMILGFLFIMSSKAKGADIYRIYAPERAPIRNHMVPNNFNRNDRNITNDEWRRNNSVYRWDDTPRSINPLTNIFRSNAASQRARMSYSAPNYVVPNYNYSSPTVVYQNPAVMDNPTYPAGYTYMNTVPMTRPYSTEYMELRNHMLPENINRNDRTLDDASWTRNNIVVR